MAVKTGTRSEGAVAQATALGVVIEIPSPLDASLIDWRREYGGDQAAAVAPHITLVSGSTTDWESAAAHVRAVASRIASFTVRMRGTGTFRPISPVVFLNVTEGAEECGELHDALVAGPLLHELAYGYHPHLTIAHDVDEAVMDRAQEELRGVSMGFVVEKIGLFGLDSTGAWSRREELGLDGPSL
ncbi:MAG: 2'-5' RNA ligase family protein [Micrococcaceae bacterium]|nr:2'-5' RNA ligase family protein [Micrococcaceae bacterium]